MLRVAIVSLLLGMIGAETLAYALIWNAERGRKDRSHEDCVGSHCYFATSLFESLTNRIESMPLSDHTRGNLTTNLLTPKHSAQSDPLYCSG